MRWLRSHPPRAEKVRLERTCSAEKSELVKKTPRQRKPEVHCRLDFFLISQGIATCVTNAEISPGYKTDHSMITIFIITNTNPRGRGFWKLNTSFLNDKEYVNQIKETITEVSQEYESDNAVDDSLLREMIKLKIREYSLKYASIKKAKRKNTEAELEADISHHEQKLERNDLSNEEKETIIKELTRKKQAFKEINRHKTKGCIIRSRTRWYNEGEKKTVNTF